MRDRRCSAESPSEYLTRGDVAEILACSLDTIDRRIRSGVLKAMRDGGLVRISRADLQTYIQRSKKWHR
jgi:excisionase family DNA binding protein